MLQQRKVHEYEVETINEDRAVITHFYEIDDVCCVRFEVYTDCCFIHIDLYNTRPSTIKVTKELLWSTAYRLILGEYGMDTVSIWTQEERLLRLFGDGSEECRGTFNGSKLYTITFAKRGQDKCKQH